MQKQYWFLNSKPITITLLIFIALIGIGLELINARTLPVKQNSISTIPEETQIEGNKEDLVSFSITPGQEVSGKVHATGMLSGGYFFEANVPISVLDEQKNVIFMVPGTGAEWMTSKPVSFSVDFDFSKAPKGKGYIKITQDDPSGGESGLPIRSVLIPIVIK